MRILNDLIRPEDTGAFPKFLANRTGRLRNFVRSIFGVRCILALLLLCAISLHAAEPTYNSATISGLGARNIGSATMSGRISCIAGKREPSGKITLLVG